MPSECLLCFVFAALVFQIRAIMQDNYPPSSPFSKSYANSGALLSEVAYCKKEKYASFPFLAPVQDFIVDGIIYDSATDTQGYYGRLPSAKQIWVVYRGTYTSLNWWDDAESRLVNPGYSNCSTCKVHKGFNVCSTNTVASVEKGITALLYMNPTYSVFVTGHSLGAAVATLTAVSLKQAGVDAYLYNYGSPRVGNAAFSNYVSTLFVNDFVPQRLTHHKDPIPHTPYESWGYVHISNEVYEDENGDLHGCKGPDDPTCAEQYAFYQSDVSDHLVYLGFNMTSSGCETGNDDVHSMLLQISKHIQQNY